MHVRVFLYDAIIAIFANNSHDPSRWYCHEIEFVQDIVLLDMVWLGCKPGKKFWPKLTQFQVKTSTTPLPVFSGPKLEPFNFRKSLGELWRSEVVESI